VNLLLLHPDERSVPLTDARAVHISTVLKLTVGDSIKAGVVDGPLGVAKITAWSDTSLEFDFQPESDPPPLPEVELILGHPRPLVLRRLFRDLATIGLRRVLVVHTDLGERSYFNARVWDQLDTALLEGVALGGSTLLPVVERHHTLHSAIGAVEQTRSLRIVTHLHEDPQYGDKRVLPDLLASHDRCPVVGAVGAERGWSDTEVRSLLDAGFHGVSLGERILRTENAAAIVAWSMVTWYGGQRR
jgi:RsmE family RNA methyltransferase